MFANTFKTTTNTPLPCRRSIGRVWNSSSEWTPETLTNRNTTRPKSSQLSDVHFQVKHQPERRIISSLSIIKSRLAQNKSSKCPTCEWKLSAFYNISKIFANSFKRVVFSFLFLGFFLWRGHNRKQVYNLLLEDIFSLSQVCHFHQLFCRGT